MYIYTYIHMHAITLLPLVYSLGALKRRVNFGRHVHFPAHVYHRVALPACRPSRALESEPFARFLEQSKLKSPVAKTPIP